MQKKIKLRSQVASQTRSLMAKNIPALMALLLLPASVMAQAPNNQTQQNPVLNPASLQSAPLNGAVQANMSYPGMPGGAASAAVNSLPGAAPNTVPNALTNVVPGQSANIPPLNPQGAPPAAPGGLQNLIPAISPLFHADTPGAIAAPPVSFVDINSGRFGKLEIDLQDGQFLARGCRPTCI